MFLCRWQCLVSIYVVGSQMHLPKCKCYFSQQIDVTKVPSGGDDDATEGNQAEMLGMMKS